MGHGEIQLSGPDLGEVEERLVVQVLRSGRLSIGPMVERFERMVCERVGTRHGVAVSSGTTGLRLVLEALGVGPGDEVITTSFSFIASANVIVQVGARPVFVDVCPASLNMDPSLVERAITGRTKAILAVEALGNPTHMDTIARIGARHEIPVIEDSCEALGTTLGGRACGSFGRAGVFGFYPNKQVTTGEGGMIVTDDERLAAMCRSLRNQGRPIGQVKGTAGSWLTHERIGHNARMSEVSAAIGVGQMTRLDELIEKRQRVAETYMRRLAGVSELVLPTVGSDAVMSWFVFVVRLAAGYTGEERDGVVAGLRTHEIGSADYFPCIHLQQPYRERFGCREGMLPIAESVSQRTIALPFHPRLTVREVEVVAQTLEVLISGENLRRR